MPQIARLDNKRRQSLKNILSQPKKANKVLDLMEAVITDKAEEE
jgi:hypothetical protein